MWVLLKGPINLLLKRPNGHWVTPGQRSNTVFKSLWVSSDLEQGGSKLLGRRFPPTLLASPPQTQRYLIPSKDKLWLSYLSLHVVFRLYIVIGCGGGGGGDSKPNLTKPIRSSILNFFFYFPFFSFCQNGLDICIQNDNRIGWVILFLRN